MAGCITSIADNTKIDAINHPANSCANLRTAILNQSVISITGNCVNTTKCLKRNLFKGLSTRARKHRFPENFFQQHLATL